MTLHVSPSLAAGLKALAAARNLSVEDYLQQLVDRELPYGSAEPVPSEGSGMVWEDGLFVYRTGGPLPGHGVDAVIRRSRDERLHRILGDRS